MAPSISRGRPPDSRVSRWPAVKLRAHACTAGQICDLFGITEHTLRGWLEEGCPIVRKGERGQSHVFHAAQVFRWWADRKVAEAYQPDDAAIELSRLRRSQRALIDLRIEQMRASLLPRDDTVRAWEAIRQMFTERMARALADAAAKGWHPDTLAELEASVAEALAELRGDPLSRNGDDSELPDQKTSGALSR